MASIKLKHASGNSTILNSPAANPSADVTLKLPSTTGSAGQVLTVASANHSSTNAELEFAAAGGGKILQAVTASTTSTVSNTTETFADTGLTATISISSGSRVLVLCVQHLDVQRGSGTGSCSCAMKLLRGSTDIFAPGNTKNVGIESSTDVQKILFLPLNFSFLDTGASTGSNTYKLQGRVQSANQSARVRFQDDNNKSVMTLLEVGA